MQQAELVETGNRKRMEPTGETLAVLRGSGESFSELSHDARNMVTALALYCELLEEPGVLTEGARHFVQELRLVTAASCRLLEKLARVEQRGPGKFAGTPAWRGAPLVEALPGTRPAGAHAVLDAPRPSSGSIEDLEEQLTANRDLLAALAGPGMTVRVRCTGGGCPVRLNGEDMTRILVNLVRNSEQAMQGTGSIKILLSELPGEKEGTPWVRLTVEDSGPGFPAADLGRVFEKGFSTHNVSPRSGAKIRKSSGRRGQGLSIVRNLVEAAGGRITAGSCAGGGARLAIELPVRMD